MSADVVKAALAGDTGSKKRKRKYVLTDLEREYGINALISRGEMDDENTEIDDTSLYEQYHSCFHSDVRSDRKISAKM
jgi:hypothetical protein